MDNFLFTFNSIMYIYINLYRIYRLSYVFKLTKETIVFKNTREIMEHFCKDIVLDSKMYKTVHKFEQEFVEMRTHKEVYGVSPEDEDEDFQAVYG